jgi:spermidine synthase
VRLPVRGVAALLFFSGACALVYQVAWFRELRLIFGASTASSAAVLAIFMGGLGLGGAYLGKRADASPNPLAMYAKLEIGVACAAGATPALVWVANTAYLGAGGSIALGSVGAALLRLVLSVLVLGPATFLMGGTLPAAAKAVEREDDGARRSVGTLYGVNTMGAVLGAVLANFLLLEVLGTRMTLWTATLVNLLVGVIARSVARRNAQALAPLEAQVEEPADDASGAPAVPRWFPPGASALVGASFMLMELTWYRMLAPLLGGSSYTFGLILAVALVGIAAGGVIYARSKVPATLQAFSITCALEALFIAIPYALGDRIAIVTALLRPLCRVGFGASTAVWTAVAAFVILPAAIVSGIQFPLVIGLYGRGARGVGRDVGDAYLANTLGSIAGSLAGGFGLIPLLGALGVWKLVVVSLAVGATAGALLHSRGADGPKRGRHAATGALLTCLPLLLLLATGPTAVWRHSGIGAGRADLKIERVAATGLAAYARGEQRGMRWHEDGVESSVALRQERGFTFVVNGKADGHALVDAPTQVMSGMLPALLHGAPKSALVVGLGTGSTAGWLAAVASVARVDVVELEPAILRVARDCGPVNEHVLDNPKVRVHLADAREYLRTTRERYDIVFSEPSNPYRAGISSLYTAEYYAAAADRVTPGGSFVQWLQAYEVDGWAIATAIVTLRKHFADVEVWRTMRGDLVLIARAEHEAIDVGRLRAMLAEDTYRRAAASAWRTSTAEGILAHFVASSGLADVLVERGLGAVNTDDQNFLEFSFARSVGQMRIADDDLRLLAVRLGFGTPETVGRVDWSRVRDERWLFQQIDGEPLSPRPATVPDDRFGPFVGAMSDGQFPVALRIWRGLAPTHGDMLGAAALAAEAAAKGGSVADVPLLDGAPERERDALLSMLAARNGNDELAAAALVRAFMTARSDPWMRGSILGSAITSAPAVAARAPSHARALYEALREPFAVEAARDARLVSAASVAMVLPDPAACVEAFHALEPPPLERAILEPRVACYTRAHDPRATAAAQDLFDILEHDMPIGASIPTPPRPAPPRGAARPSRPSRPSTAPDARRGHASGPQRRGRGERPGRRVALIALRRTARACEKTPFALSSATWRTA